ncbi:iron-sulfur cluster-binding protein [Citricoccus zhacaiensis]|uniref:Iron-sulfur cluster-binding protein n=2 Tax=Citricoccus zhacaiensis TaxID=489142 RepID=A0ABQ2LPR6_9MICC|nr:iron-sulfur cluster-binding protein [Citricoccus zhacaiensis]
MPTIRPVHGHGNLHADVDFPTAAKEEMANIQMRANIRHATHTIRGKRARVVEELPDWQELRTAGSALKEQVMANLPELLEQFEKNFTARGGTVHWARDAAEANRIITELIEATGTTDVIKVKSMATAEIDLERHLAEHGITATETDLAELIVQLGHDRSSHILVPAIHKNRHEIRDIFLSEMPETDDSLTSEPRDLAEAARAHLREKFLSTSVAVSGANFGVTETGTLTVVESEGNGRMCLTLPDTLITVMGIEKLVPTFQDLEVYLQLLPRSSTGERMNPYTSMWTGVTPGDGPQDVHVVLLDNGRSAVLADPAGRSALHCIRCSACLNVCPVYEQAGGHAYGSTYPGPIGAILSPQMTGITAAENSSLPYASSLCGACYDVCPVKINIPEILVHLRDEDVRTRHGERPPTEQRPTEEASPGLAGRLFRRLPRVPSEMDVMMKGASTVMSSGRRMALAEKALPLGRALAGRDRAISWLPGMAGGWTDERDIPAPPRESFRNWWADHAAETEDRVRQDGGSRHVPAPDRADHTDEEDSP